MEIILAKSAGFCFGVKRAVDMANSSASKDTYSYGELVHNKNVVKELEDKGVRPYNSNVKNKKVIIRSHGIHKDILKDLINDGNEIIDCVCPKVKYIYNIVEKNKDDRQIIIIGKKDHPEVIGINSHCDDKAIIIEELDDIKNIPLSKSIVVSQTTNEQNFFKNATNIIKAILKDDVLVYNTICSATKIRQDEVKSLAKEVDAMIVLGGSNSSNTKKTRSCC